MRTTVEDFESGKELYFGDLPHLQINTLLELEKGLFKVLTCKINVKYEAISGPLQIITALNITEE